MVPKHPIDLSLLAETYEITPRRENEVLTEWLSASYSLTDFEEKLLRDVFERTKDYINYFNEEELKIQLISHIFYLAALDLDGQIKVYYERPLSAVVGEFRLSVVADCLVATPMPFNKPRKPYFFLQEFKKGKGDNKDPEAQMLMAMLIAQQKNQDGKPIYGSFIIGANWFFTTLTGTDYCLSREFNAANYTDLVQIVFLLRHLRTLILER